MAGHRRRHGRPRTADSRVANRHADRTRRQEAQGLTVEDHPCLALLLFPAVLATAGGPFAGLHDQAGSLLAQGTEPGGFFTAVVQGF